MRRCGRCGASSDAAIHRYHPGNHTHEFVRVCDKFSRSVCGLVVATVVCSDCGVDYARCEAHGGEAGARRSLKSHRGLYHPAPPKEDG